MKNLSLLTLLFFLLAACGTRKDVGTLANDTSKITEAITSEKEESIVNSLNRVANSLESLESKLFNRVDLLIEKFDDLGEKLPEKFDPLLADVREVFTLIRNLLKKFPNLEKELLGETSVFRNFEKVTGSMESIDSDISELKEGFKTLLQLGTAYLNDLAEKQAQSGNNNLDELHLGDLSEYDDL